MIYHSSSPDETMAIARDMAKNARAGDIIALSGDLGAGKTVFVKGFAEGLGVKGIINSPTFTLMQIYDDGRLPIYHFDLYRLMDASYDDIDIDTLEEIGFFEYMDGDEASSGAGVCLIEWAEYARGFIPDSAIWVELRRTDKADKSDKADKLGESDKSGEVCKFTKANKTDYIEGEKEDGSFEKRRKIHIRGL